MPEAGSKMVREREEMTVAEPGARVAPLGMMMPAEDEAGVTTTGGAAWAVEGFCGIFSGETLGAPAPEVGAGFGAGLLLEGVP